MPEPTTQDVVCTVLAGYDRGIALTANEVVTMAAELLGERFPGGGAVRSALTDLRGTRCPGGRQSLLAAGELLPVDGGHPDDLNVVDRDDRRAAVLRVADAVSDRAVGDGHPGPVGGDHIPAGIAAFAAAAARDGGDRRGDPVRQISTFCPQCFELSRPGPMRTTHSIVRFQRCSHGSISSATG